MKVLVTGASGFIGRNICNLLSERGNCEIIGIYNANLPQHLSEAICTIQVDLNDGTTVNRLFKDEKFDAVIHLAGQMKVTCINDYLNNTVISTRNIVNAAESSRVGAFILSSSVMVYGNAEGEVDENTDRTNPDDYGMTKYIQERILGDSSIHSRTVLRLPRTLGRYVNLGLPYLPRLGGTLIKNDDVTYYNPNQDYNNMLHVDSLYEFIATVLENKGDSFAGYDVFNLAASVPMTVYEVTAYLKERLGSDSKLIERKENIPRSNTSCIRVKKAVQRGFRPLTVVETLDRFADDLKHVKVNGGIFAWE